MVVATSMEEAVKANQLAKEKAEAITYAEDLTRMQMS